MHSPPIPQIPERVSTPPRTDAPCTAQSDGFAPPATPPCASDTGPSDKEQSGLQPVPGETQDAPTTPLEMAHCGECTAQEHAISARRLDYIFRRISGLQNSSTESLYRALRHYRGIDP